MLIARRDEGRPTQWQSGEEVFDWWMQDKNMDKQIEGQECIWSDETAQHK